MHPEVLRSAARTKVGVEGIGLLLSDCAHQPVSRSDELAHMLADLVLVRYKLSKPSQKGTMYDSQIARFQTCRDASSPGPYEALA